MYGYTDRAEFFEVDLLNENCPLPKGFDVIWMSQFLDCFSENEIVSILKRCYDALPANGQVIILEPLWDKQTYEVSAFCLQMTSLYFTAMANGNSQMYHSELFTGLIRKAVQGKFRKGIYSTCNNQIKFTCFDKPCPKHY